MGAVRHSRSYLVRFPLDLGPTEPVPFGPVWDQLNPSPLVPSLGLGPTEPVPFGPFGPKKGAGSRGGSRPLAKLWRAGARVVAT